MHTTTSSLIPSGPFVAAPALSVLTLDRDIVRRISHVMSIGAAKLTDDIAAFEAAAVEYETNPPEEDPTGKTIDIRGPHFPEAMRSMAEEFRRYVTETTEIVSVMGAIEYGPMQLALVTDRDTADEAREVLGEIAEELA